MRLVGAVQEVGDHPCDEALAFDSQLLIRHLTVPHGHEAELECLPKLITKGREPSNHGPRESMHPHQQIRGLES